MNDDRRVYATYIHATPEQVWAALTTPASTRFYFDFIEGFLSVESDWRAGSPVRWRTADGTSTIEGEVLAVEAPTRLVTTLSLRYDEEVRRDRPSRMAWEITPMGEVCKLVAVHDDTDGETRTVRDAAVCLPSILSNLRVLLETGKPRLIKEVVVDCASPAALGTFWAAALGYLMHGPTPTVEDAFVAIIDPLGVGPELGFQRVPEPKVGKNRVHLDLRVTDRAAEVARLVALGATSGTTYHDGAWTVMADPEGNEFCVVAR